MAKFNTRTRAPAQGPIRSEQYPSGKTAEGAQGYARDEKSELFLLAVSAFAAEGSFYEAARSREDRARHLLKAVSHADMAWLEGFLPWLRDTANMRTAPLMMAADAVAWRLKARQHGGNRQLIASVLRRADEPGELLSYWISRHGRNIPKPVKRGIADALTRRRLYGEYSLLKYDTASHAMRFGDVLELTHARPATPYLSHLYRLAIDMRHGRDYESWLTDDLRMVWAQGVLRMEAAERPEVLLDSDRLARAGMTWEDALSLAGGRLDKRQLWLAAIPNMGYMALLRNLRNFDDAGLTDAEVEPVIAKLRDPEQVARSRQFPYRFHAAYVNAPSLRWARALETALGYSLRNVPELKGRTLILVDCSGSMADPMSGKSKISRYEAAAIFGAGLAVRCEHANLVQFGTGYETVPFRKSESVLRIIERFKGMGGTNTAQAVAGNYYGHDRVVLITDEQAMPGYYWSDAGDVFNSIPARVPTYTWNLAGYQHGHAASRPGRHTLGGLSDASWRLVPLLERGQDAPWPWEGID